MSATVDCHFVPLYTSRIISYTLCIVSGAIGVASCFWAKHKSSLTKGDAQVAVQRLTPGVTLTIDTNDVVTAGIVEGLAQMGLAILGLLSLVLLITDTKKRFAVPNAPQVLNKKIWSSHTLILQVLCWVIAVCASLSTSIVTTLFVATRQAKVTSVLPNGAVMAQSLVDAFQKKLGISPVYKNQDYLVFMATSPWFGFFFSTISLYFTYVAWRRHAARPPAYRPPSVEESFQNNSTEKF